MQKYTKNTQMCYQSKYELFQNNIQHVSQDTDIHLINFVF